jgi:hypothetical protein
MNERPTESHRAAEPDEAGATTASAEAGVVVAAGCREDRRLLEPEPRPRRVAYLLLAVALAALYLAMLLQFWAPAHGGVDQNGYFVGGRQIADTGTMQYTPTSPFGFVGSMWVMTEDGRNFPKYPIGLPLLFAACFWIGGDANGWWLSNLVSPVSAALSLLGVFLLTRRLAGSFAGILAMILLGTSQATLLLANNPNSHAPALAFVTWGMYLLVAWWQNGSAWRGLLAGLLIGYAATIRYTEALLLLPVAIAVLTRLPWRHPRDPAVSRVATLAIAAAGMIALVVGGLVVPMAHLFRHPRDFDPPMLLLLALATPIPWLAMAVRRAASAVASRREWIATLALVVVPLGLATLAALGRPDWLLAIPLALAWPLWLVADRDADLDWPRVTLAGSLAIVLAAITLPGLSVRLETIVAVGLVSMLLLLRWRDLRDPRRPTLAPLSSVVRPMLALLSLAPLAAVLWSVPPEHALRGTLVWIASLLPAVVAVGVCSLSRDAGGHFRALLDAPRVLAAACVLAIALPFVTLFPDALREKEWTTIPLAAAAIGIVVMLFATHARSARELLTPHLPMLGWAVPVGALLAWNLVEMGTLTGYDSTNESDGKAFTLANFLANWEKVIRQVHDVGLFFVAPLGVLGLIMLFRRSGAAALLLLSWLVPGLVIYAAYYWSPERGTSYLRFFLTLFPALVTGAAYALWHGVLSDESLGWRMRRSVALPIAAGVVVAIASGLGVYRAIEGFESGVRSAQSLEGMYHGNLILAEFARSARAAIPDGSLVFADTNGGWFSRSMNYLQFVGRWQLFPHDAFTPRGVRGQAGAPADPDTPAPLQGRRRQFIADLYRGRTDEDLLEEQRQMIDDALATGRRVFVLADAGGRAPFADVNDGRWQTRVAARVPRVVPALPVADPTAAAPSRFVGAPPGPGGPPGQGPGGNRRPGAAPRERPPAPPAAATGNARQIIELLPKPAAGPAADAI